MQVFCISYCACFHVHVICSVLLHDYKRQPYIPPSLKGGLIKGISGYKTAHNWAHSSFVRLFVFLYCSFSLSCETSSRLVFLINPVQQNIIARCISDLPRVPVTGAAEQGEQLLPQIYQWGSSAPPTSHKHYFVYTEQPKSILYACCEELRVNANLLQSESAQSRQQSFLLHEQPFRAEEFTLIIVLAEIN